MWGRSRKYSWVASVNSGDSTDRVTILIVDDETQIRRALKNALADDSTLVLEAATGAAAVDCVATAQPELMILDLGLPDLDGIEVCREVRQWSGCVIVVLSARHSELQKVALLGAGADDYVTKPFSVSELRARVRAHLRRARRATEPGGPTRVEVDGLVVDLVARRATREGVTIHLTPFEWRILATLITDRGRTLTHRQIFDRVWRRVHGNPQQYLRVHVTNLRRKIERDPAAPRVIITEPGVGYRVELGD